jgi:hypothetical protein
MIITTNSMLREWCSTQSLDGMLDDPDVDVPVCTLVFTAEEGAAQDELRFGFSGAPDWQLFLQLGPERLPVNLTTAGEQPEISDGFELTAFGIVKLGRGVWVLNPSLNIPGELHAYVILRNVPDPAPWEKPRILIATEMPAVGVGHG